MTNKTPNTKLQTPNNQVEKHPFDLVERTTQFGEAVLLFTKSITPTITTKVLIVQIIRSGTSIGANYMEADGAESPKDFRHIVARCKKEAKETRYWLHMFSIVCADDLKEQLRTLWKEADELTRIFASMMKK